MTDLFDAGNIRVNYVRNIKRTVETYDVEFRVLLELLQNAIDATRKNAAISVGHVSATVNVEQGTVTVIDDGVGFPSSPDLLYLGGTDKASDPTQAGRIGVGLKAVIFSSSRFRIDSNTPSGTFKFEVSNASAALEHALANPAAKLEPSINESAPHGHPVPPTGTRIEVTFDRRLLLRWLESAYQSVFGLEELGTATKEEAATLLYQHGQPFPSKAEALLPLYLRTSPYTGDVNQLLHKSKMPVEITLKVDTGIGTVPDYTDFPKLKALLEGQDQLETTQPCEYLDVEELYLKIPAKKRRANLYNHPIPPGGGSAGTTLRDHIWVNKLTDSKSIESLITDRKNQINWGGTAPIKDRITGAYLVMGSTDVLRAILPGGPIRAISARGVLTAHNFVTPRTGRNELFVPYIHLLVDVDEELNYGKRNLNDNWLVKRCNELFATAYRSTLYQVGTQLAPSKQKLPSPSDRSYIGQPALGIASVLQKVPACEQDVIALFFGLLAEGKFGELRIFGLSTIEQYDAKFLAKRTGDSKFPSVPLVDDKLYNLEFKDSLSKLLTDFDSGVKDADEIQLVVCWENDYDNTDPRYKVYDADQSRLSEDDKLFENVHLVLADQHTFTEIPVIELRQTVEGILASDGGGGGANGGTSP